MRNIQANPRVALVIDDYSEEWSALAYVLVRGSAEVMEDGPERDRAEAMLRGKYPQYASLLEEGCTVLKIVPSSVISWGILVRAAGQIPRKVFCVGAGGQVSRDVSCGGLRASKSPSRGR